jgi:HAD superfamily phosphoserine phosphatase-like hydrolase
MKHNVYDFDKTIYQGDSTYDFYRFCLNRRPAILVEIPVVFLYAVLFTFRLCSMTAFKEKFFRFLRHLESVDELAEEFWEEHRDMIYDFYRKGRREDDIVISASPEFLLLPICRSLKIGKLIASRVDKNTGLFDGENCWGEEKLKRLREELPEVTVGEFYSDSVSDAPLAGIAEKAYIAQHGELIPWEDYRPGFSERMKIRLRG